MKCLYLCTETDVKSKGGIQIQGVPRQGHWGGMAGRPLDPQMQLVGQPLHHGIVDHGI